MTEIIPRGIHPDACRVRPVEFAVRTLVDYDASFMRDRLRCDIFVDGNPAGVYAALAIPDTDRVVHPAEIIDRFGSDVERSVIDEFMGLGYRRQVRDLEARVKQLQARLDRPRWWQFHPVRRAWAKFQPRGMDDEERREFHMGGGL